jgi:hypothetical protein
MKNQNSLENPKTPIHPPGLGVRALCAALLVVPVLLGALLFFKVNASVHDSATGPESCSSLFNFVQVCSR